MTIGDSSERSDILDVVARAAATRGLRFEQAVRIHLLDGIVRRLRPDDPFTIRGSLATRQVVPAFPRVLVLKAETLETTERITMDIRFGDPLVPASSPVELRRGFPVRVRVRDPEALPWVMGRVRDVPCIEAITLDGEDLERLPDGEPMNERAAGFSPRSHDVHFTR